MSVTTQLVGFMRFVPFAGLEAWGYAALFPKKKHALLFAPVPLAELITHRKGFITINDAETYSRCRVQLRAQGVVRRDKAAVAGSAIKTKKQQVCRAGDFLVAEIDAKLGGFGIVPPELNGAVVSSHYFLFDVREERLRRDYLALCLRTQFFQKQVQATGSTNYAAIRPNHVLGYSIPLPSLTEQARLVALNQAAVSEAAKANKLATEREQEAAQFLETALGLKAEIAKPKLAAAKLHFVPFATLERWGEVFQGASDSQASSKFPMVRLGSVIANLQNGWSPKCLTRRAALEEWGVLKLGAVSFGEFDEAANKALPAHLKPTPEYEIQAGDVLISRANITQYVGACVFVAKSRMKLILCDKIFRVAFHDASTIERQFIVAVMKTAMVRRQIEASVTGTSPTMKNISKPALLRLRFPLPPLAEQNRIVARLDTFRDEARRFRAEADSGMAKVTQAFEAALFGVPVVS